MRKLLPKYSRKHNNLHMDEQLEFFKQIASRLDSAGIPYMMTGSMAMAIYATPRMTRDIDLIVEIELIDVEKIVKLFADDCYVDKASVRQAVHDRGIFNIIHNDWLIKADFIVRKDEDYRLKEFSRRRIIDIEGSAIAIVAPEDLILSKLIWGKRSQSELQLRDVKQMIVAMSELDHAYLQKWATILGVDDLLKKAKENE